MLKRILEESNCLAYLVALLLATVLTSAAKAELAPNTAQETYTIAGRVTLLNTESPLAGVTITLSNGQSVSTNSQGEFAFTLAAGSYTLTPQMAGYNFRPKTSESILIPPADTTYHFIAVENKWPWTKDESLALNRTWHGPESGWDGIDFYSGNIANVSIVLAMNDGVITSNDVCIETVTDASAPGGQRNVGTILVRQNDNHNIHYLHLNADTIPLWIRNLVGSGKGVHVVQGQYLGNISAGTWSGSCAGGQFTAGQNNSQGHLHLDVPDRYLLVEGWEILAAESQDTCFTRNGSNLCVGENITSHNPKVECDAMIGAGEQHNGSTLCRKYTVVHAVGNYNKEIAGVLQRVAPVYSDPIQQTIVGWVKDGALGLVICQSDEEAYGCPNTPRVGDYYWRVAWVEDSFVALDSNGKINEPYWVREHEFREFTSSAFPDIFFGQTHFPDIAIVAEQGLFRGFSDGEFKREREITRGETAVAVARWLLGKNLKREDIACADIQLDTNDSDVTCTGAVPTQSPRFNDIGNNSWSSQIDRGIEYLRQNAFVRGFSPENCIPVPPDGFTCYKPNNTITRAEFTTIIMRIFESRYDAIHGSGAYDQMLNSLPNPEACDFGSELDGSPHELFIMDACKLEIVSGYSDGKFRPDELIQRQQAAKIIGRAFLYMVDPTTFDDTHLAGVSAEEMVEAYDFAANDVLLEIREPNRAQLPDLPPHQPTAATGDSNGDSHVDAGDISALILEIFDGDGELPSDAPGGSFPGTAGCDANQDNKCDAGDISCTILLIFNGAGACGGENHSSQFFAIDLAAPLDTTQTPPVLSLPSLVTTTAGSQVALPILYSANGHSLSTLTFSIDYDERWLSINGTDSDEDGIPDAVVFNVPPAFSSSASLSVNDTDGELDIVIFDPAPPLAELSSRNVVTLTFTVGAPPTSTDAVVAFSLNPAASFGSNIGTSVSGQVEGAIVRILGPTALPPIEQPAQKERVYFLPSIMQ